MTRSAATTPAASGSTGRLRNGELRRRVAEVLADRPSLDLSACEIANILSRSSGAVGNALTTLTATGHAEQTSTKPVRYTATATTADAAAGPAFGSATGTPAPTSAPPLRSGPTRPATSGAERSATSAPSETPSGVVSGPVERPNGQMYHPRLLSGIPDVTALRKLREAGVPALMYGPPGTGKTSVVEAAYADLITVQGDGDTAVADFVGEYTQNPDGTFTFVHGPLVRAMREGRALFIDDATLIPPTVLAVVYPAMDGRKQIIIKAHGGEVVDAAPGFYVVAGHNPGVHGAVLTDALASRFAVQVQVSTDFDLAKQLKVDRRAVLVARQLAKRQASGEIGWAPQLRELLAFQKITSVLGVEAAAGNLVGTAPEDDREVVASVVRGAFGADVAPLALGARI